jgi:hypothetical protein
MVTWIVLGIIGLAFLIFILPGFFIIGARDVGVLTRKNFGTRLPEGHIIACNGEIGIQADVLRPGFYWRFPILWGIKKDKIIVVNPGEVGLVKSVDGVTLLANRVLGDEVECDSFQDAKKFLTTGGYRGAQIGFLRPGTYRINTSAFDVAIQKATIVPENSIGIVMANDGIPLSTSYVIAPRPKDSDNQDVADSSLFQNGQLFIKSKGYRGAQLDTLQPGTYYINTLLFKVNIQPIAEVPPGYVAVIRSNVGIELERSVEKPIDSESSNLKDKVHADVERLLTTDKYTRGIWREPIAPGKYNLNPLAFTPYLVPTSAVTIDWAAEGRIGTEVKGVTNEGVLYKFNPLKVTSKDGFQLEVNIRIVIRITQENASFIIARFGSVDNLIDQIVHPLIDASFRNKAGEKKAIDFFQSRTDLQVEALNHAKSVFEEYNVLAQNLLVAYIDIPQSLLDTQTQKEIALQQQAQFVEQAKAQEQNIAVQEKAARALKQKDVINAKLEIDIKTDLASARMKEAEGESVYLQKTNAATGKGLAEGYQAQKDALGEEGTTLVNIIKALADKGLKFVPEVQVGNSEGGLGALIGSLTAKFGKELAQKPEVKTIEVDSKSKED